MRVPTSSWKWTLQTFCMILICSWLVSVLNKSKCQCSTSSRTPRENAIMGERTNETAKSVVAERRRKSEAKNEKDKFTVAEKISKPEQPKRELNVPALGWLKRVKWIPGARADEYDFMKNPIEKCKLGHNNRDNNRRVTLLVLVKSATYHFALRDKIRNTYVIGITKYNMSVKVVFSLGYPKKEQEQVQINEEARLHGDILQADYVEHYYNLTKKFVMGLKWAAKFCDCEFVMSTDDDIMVDIVTLAKDLQGLPLEERTNFVAGKQNGNPVDRNEYSKWYCPKELYPEDWYPPFPLGHGIILSHKVTQKLYEASRELPPEIPFDDVYCGILLKALGIEIRDREGWFKNLHPQKRPVDYVKLQLQAETMNTAWEEFEKNL
nr:beta-1,3-galactosyltransferase 5-like [Lytechinus pictus]